MHEEKAPECVFKDILTMTETESRLSLGMTSNKTYHFQTTANHYRFIKVWTSIADLPTSKFFVQTFFSEKVWLESTLPTYSFDICPKIRSFFLRTLSLSLISLIPIKSHIYPYVRAVIWLIATPNHAKVSSQTKF